MKINTKVKGIRWKVDMLFSLVLKATTRTATNKSFFKRVRGRK